LCTGGFILVHTNSPSVQPPLDSNLKKNLIFNSKSVEFGKKFK
jgi:hypothetical protein